MKVRKYTEVKLNPKDENLVFTVLDLAGWYKGRDVNIEEVEYYYEKNNCKFNEMSKAFFREFYGLPSQFCFAFKYPNKDEFSIGGYELYFDTSISNELFYFESDDDKQEFETEKSLVAKYEPKGFTPVAFCGYHLGGTLWIGNSGKIYRTYYFSSDAVENYNSVIEMLECDFESYKKADELFVSFGGYAKEWGVGGDFYMKKYLKEYGE